MILLTMLNQYLIEKLAKDLKIAPLNIIREYYEIEVLFHLSQTKLAENMIFYGGTALRLAYQSFRFSEDLDFLLIRDSKQNWGELTKALKDVVHEDPGISLEEIREKRWTLFALLHITNVLLKHPIRIKIEISKKKNGVESENLLLSSPVSGKEVIFPVASLESMYKLKADAIRERNVPRDWFDFWYLSQKLHRDRKTEKKFPFPKQEFARELKRWLPQDKWKIIETLINFYEKS